MAGETLSLREDLASAWRGKDPFDVVRSVKGEEIKVSGRGKFVATRRVTRFELNGKNYYVKIHAGTGWVYIIKKLLLWGTPILNIGREALAIRHLQTLGINTPVVAGYGVRGRNPARQLSFVITEEIMDVIPLSEFCATWNDGSTSPGFKRSLIQEVGRISAVLHKGGVLHRDPILEHFLLDMSRKAEPLKLTVIDLHKSSLKNRLSKTGRIRDLANLYRSALDVGLTKRDLLFFMLVYEGKTWRRIRAENISFWRRVKREARRTYRHHYRKKPVFVM